MVVVHAEYTLRAVQGRCEYKNLSITSLNALLTVVAVEDVYTGPEVFQRVAVVPESQQSGTRNTPATAVVPPFSQTGIGLVRSWENLRCILHNLARCDCKIIGLLVRYS